jgi:hypothetical protein
LRRLIGRIQFTSQIPKMLACIVRAPCRARRK